MRSHPISVPQARKILGEQGALLSDAQIAKLLDVLKNLADYSLALNRNELMTKNDPNGSK